MADSNAIRSKRWRERHPERAKKAQRKIKIRAKDRKTLGVCVDCGEQPPVLGNRTCEVCSDARRRAQWKQKGLPDIPTEVYLMLQQKQQNCCAICLHPPKKRRLALDHDHKTGKVRGLLCYRCNYGLGWVEWFTKDPARFVAMKTYLGLE